MLVDSPRLTAADREVWRGRLSGDRLAWGRRMERLQAQARGAVEDFVGAGAAYASVSWGKDSLVVAHIVQVVAPAVPLVWCRLVPLDNPDCEAVRDAFVSRWAPIYHEVVVQASGRQERRGQEGYRLTEERFGARRIMGIRAQESRERRMSAGVHGVATANVCRPILHWTIDDVFAYLAHYDIPTHPAYAMTMGGLLQREEIRVAYIGGSRGGERRRVWERAYYPDIAP